jgi:hypothetical protein
VNGRRGRFLGDNAFLLAAVMLPLLVVGFFLLASAIPRWRVPPPAYDLLIRAGRPYRLQPSPARVAVEFDVRDGQLWATVSPVHRDQYMQPWSLFLFEHGTASLRGVPFDVPHDLPQDDPPRTLMVAALSGRRILPAMKAPDGYEMRTRTGRHSGLIGDLFGIRGYDAGVSLVNRGRVVAIPLPAGYEYLSQVEFLGWLDQGPQ